jgi:NAD(P)H-nitrite reductase large subunit
MGNLASSYNIRQMRASMDLREQLLSAQLPKSTDSISAAEVAPLMNSYRAAFGDAALQSVCTRNGKDWCKALQECQAAMVELELAFSYLNSTVD